MLLLDDLRLAQHAKSTRHENWPRISRAEWLQRVQILAKLKAQRVRSNFCIDAKRRRQIIFSQTRRRMFIQAPPKFRDAIATNRQPSRMRMPAELIEQIAT